MKPEVAHDDGALAGLQVVAQHVPPAEHDLRLEDLLRQDRQNFEVRR